MLRKIKVVAFWIGAYVAAVVGTATLAVLAAVLSIVIVPFVVYPYIEESAKRIK